MKQAEKNNQVMGAGAEGACRGRSAFRAKIKSKGRRTGWIVSAVALVFLLGGMGGVPQPPDFDSPKSLGQDLYRRLSCHGCHTVQGQGGDLGPALDGVGRRLSPADLETQIATPRRRLAASRMPSFAFLRPLEFQALLDFVASEL